MGRGLSFARLHGRLTTVCMFPAMFVLYGGRKVCASHLAVCFFPTYFSFSRYTSLSAPVQVSFCGFYESWSWLVVWRFSYSVLGLGGGLLVGGLFLHLEKLI